MAGALFTDEVGAANRALIAGYAQHQQRRGLERSTIELRRMKLRAFARWLGGRSLLDATQTDVERFLDNLHGRRARSLAARTRYAWISHLDCFFDWAIAEDLIAVNPTARIIRPKLQRLLPRPISDSDLQVALQIADPRTRSWLLLAAYGGFRCIEISRLTRDDVLDGYKPPMLIAHGKGSKDRLVPLHPEVEMALRSLPMPRSGPVYMHPRTGRAWTPAQVSHDANEFLHGIGLDVTIHQLRHWFGTHLYETTHDLRLVQETMGHANPATTAIYAAFCQPEATAAVGRLTVTPEPSEPVSPP